MSTYIFKGDLGWLELRYKFNMIRFFTLLTLCIVTLISGCSSPTQSGVPSSKAKDAVSAPPKFDVTKAFYKSPKEVDQIFGQPTGGNVIKADASTKGMTPGEFRDYSWGVGKKYVLVRFFKGKAVMIQMELQEPFEDAIEAVKSVGVDPSPVTPRAEAQMATRWTAKLGGFLFKDVAAIKSTSPEGKFDMVQFELVDPD